MKVATWNLERVEPQTSQAERQQGWIQRIDADIWVFTETDQAISPGPTYRSISSGEPDRPSRHSERWIQIWVRNGEVSPVTSSDEARTACALVKTNTGADCLIYGTVLPWVGSVWRNVSSSEAFAAALYHQQADWQRLMREYPNVPFILAGDFNQDLNNLPYYGSRRNKQALRQALADSQLACLTCGNRDPVRRVTGGQHSNIDHICVSLHRGSEFLESFAWPQNLNALRGISDHFGVGIEVELKPEQ
jgi:hypothetical protein